MSHYNHFDRDYFVPIDDNLAPGDPDNSERPSGYILSIIGLEGVQGIQVCYWPDQNRFHAVTMGQEDVNLERLIDNIHEHWNDKDGNLDPENREYQAGYAYACGYYD